MHDHIWLRKGNHFIDALDVYIPRIKGGNQTNREFLSVAISVSYGDVSIRSHQVPELYVQIIIDAGSAMSAVVRLWTLNGHMVEAAQDRRYHRHLAKRLEMAQDSSIIPASKLPPRQRFQRTKINQTPLGDVNNHVSNAAIGAAVPDRGSPT